MLFLAKKRETYLAETKSLREGTGCMRPCPGLLGSLVAADVRLPLKPEFMAKLGTAHGKLSLSLSIAITLFLILISLCCILLYYCLLFLLNITVLPLTDKKA